MQELYYNHRGTILLINCTPEVGEYRVEVENGDYLGQIYVVNIDEILGTPIWVGTTANVKTIAQELGQFIERYVK